MSVAGVAIVGFSGRFPGAPDAEAFWHNLRTGVESISFFTPGELAAAGVRPELRDDPAYVPARGVLADAEGFDAPFFGLGAGEAERMDPQHRVFLEVAWEALEHAGYDPARFPGPIGVFAGTSLNSFALGRLHAALTAPGAEALLAAIANERDFLPTRTSHRLDLRGPSISVGTACSTSLVAVHLACQSLLAGECDLVLAGAVRIVLPQTSGYLHRPGDITSPDGHCRAFDADAQGTVGGNGAGVVVLKRLSEALEDGDTVHAVLRGSAVNNDGAGRIGFTAPGIEGQAAVVREALAVAGVTADEIGYVEAHGTGTPLGDPIEAAALTQAFRATSERMGYCALGSAKTNIGHLDVASGMAGLIKAVLALEHGEIPPTLHFRAPNPQIDLAASPFFVNTEPLAWPRRAGSPRRAGVSSFGLGGTNAHVILEEAPAPAPAPATAAASPSSRRDHLLVLSARSAAALEAATDRLADHLRRLSEIDSETDLANAAYTLQVGRAELPYRRIVAGREALDVGNALAARDPGRVLTRHAGHLERSERAERPVAFLLPGQGTQYVNAGRELYEREAAFRLHVDECAGLLQPHLGLDLRAVLYPPAGEEAAARRLLRGLRVGQAAVFVLDYALARLWMGWGVRPSALLGHSLGEYAAACLAGVLALPDALGLVALRSRLIESLPAGGTLAVSLPAQEVEALLTTGENDGLALAAYNAPDLCLVSGPAAAIEDLNERLTRDGVLCAPIPVPRAVHSPMTEPILDELAAAVGRLDLRAPEIPYLSNVTGTWITAAEATDPAAWARHLRRPVRFTDALARLLAEPGDRSGIILLETGAGRTLTTLAKRHPLAAAAEALLTSLPPLDEPRPAAAFLQTTLGRLWLAGAAVDWPAVQAGAPRRRIALPTYPFEHRPAGAVDAAPRPARETPYAPPETPMESRLAALWEDLLGTAPIGRHDDFFELGGHSLLALSLTARIERETGVRLAPSTLATDPTVARQARLLAAPVTASPLVALQSGGAAPPFYCVHPAGGQVLCYADLARRLSPERPFFGLRQPEGESEDLPALAAHYVQAILSQTAATAPREPILLGGWSLGGVIAYEMAQQLSALGHPPALLALIDADAPGPEAARIAADAENLRSFARALELTGIPDTAEALPWIAARLRGDGAPPDDEDLERVRRMHGRFVQLLRAAADYAPLPYAGRVALFRVAARPAGGGAGAPGLGWEGLAQGGLTIHEMPGDHWSLLREPLAGSLAEALELSFQAAPAGFNAVVLQETVR